MDTKRDPNVEVRRLEEELRAAHERNERLVDQVARLKAEEPPPAPESSLAAIFPWLPAPVRPVVFAVCFFGALYVMGSIFGWPDWR